MKNRRLIAIDDQKEILEVYETIFNPSEDRINKKLNELEIDIFEQEQTTQNKPEEIIFELEIAQQGLEGAEKVSKSIQENNPFSVAFIDMRMPPGIDGKETAKLIRKIDKDIEIVIVTAYSDCRISEIIKEVGDPSRLLLLKKPFDSDEIKQFALALSEKWNLNKEKENAQAELIKYNKKLEETVNDKTIQLRETIDKLEILSTTDPITGLYNFRKFRDEIAKEISRVNRLAEKHKSLDYSFTIAIIDLDDFKKINDTFGHLKGDMVLQKVSDVLNYNCRDLDFISRYGGDEFIIIFSDCSPETVEKICKRIINNLSNVIPFDELVKGKNPQLHEIIKNKISDQLNNSFYPIKCSIGIAEYEPGLNVDDIVGKADYALYEAKIRGKNQVMVYEELKQPN